MKILITLAVLGGAFLLILPNMSEAIVYDLPSNPEMDYKAGNCVMVNNRSETNANKVYTLNPAHTVLLNAAYVEYWSRNARCDELQFHVDHNTTLTRLRSWLGQVSTAWFQNIGATHYKHKTVSTLEYEWFYIDSEGAHRIPDWLTALSWGLLVEDRLSISSPLTNAFYDNVPMADPLNFADGVYADKMNAIWKSQDHDYSSLPGRMASEITRLVDSPEPFTSVFESCQYQIRNSGDPWYHLMDWSWMLRNPGCPLAS
ncbi:MAG: hypothetical protein Q8Q20_03985 [bacterium]|nr:hypothetical protein [bacterium]